MVFRKEIRNTVEKMVELAATRLPEDVVKGLEKAKKREENPIAENQLENMLQNLNIAKEENKPICQDTGLPIFFINTNSTEFGFGLRNVIEESIKNSTELIPLRPNVVDPLSRENSGDNTGEGHPLIHLSFDPEVDFEIELLLKGGGSENWSRLFMLNPTASEKFIKDKIIRTVKKAGGQICPPSIIGIGIGGTADYANLLAKEALLQPLEKQNQNEELAKLEKEITKSINNLGIGPMGLGGKTTTLGTKIKKAGCHTASLPLAINFNCWAARRSRATLKNGSLEIEVPK